MISTNEFIASTLREVGETTQIHIQDSMNGSARVSTRVCNSYADALPNESIRVAIINHNYGYVV